MVVNHASSRQVQWTQGKKVVFLRTCPMPKALEFFHLSESIPSHFSASFPVLSSPSPSLQAWPVEVRLIHFRIEVVEEFRGGPVPF